MVTKSVLTSLIEDIGPAKDGVNEKLPNRLEFEDSVSPSEIEGLIYYVLTETGLISPLNSRDSFKKWLEEEEKKRIVTCIKNSLLFSFIFNKKKYNRYKYLPENIEKMFKLKQLNINLGPDYAPVIDFLNKKALDEFRNLFLYIQNKNKFKNFSENKLSELLTRNFQTLNNNDANSTHRNRQFIEGCRKIAKDKHSQYYIKFKILNPAMINPCI